MIIVTGQTATGKTSLALKLAQERNGELISADSRQIYNEMDIGTGKIDKPNELVQEDSIWKLRGVPIYGINLINPDQMFSAGDFATYGRKIIADISSRGKTPIIVGGTGFYIKSLVDPDDTVSIPQNLDLRSRLEQESVENLKKILLQSDEKKYHRMNNSDINNPRRLVRAIEVATWVNSHSPLSKNTEFTTSIEWIGLTSTKENLIKKITDRVEQMFTNGFEKEVTALTQKYSWESPGLRTIGYIQWLPYFQKRHSKNEVKSNIITAHIQYARKQMIYLKRFKEISWRQLT